MTSQAQDSLRVKKAKKTVKLIDEYAEILKGGTLLVCPVTGISFTLPGFSTLPSLYMDMRHPLGVVSNYPSLFSKHETFKLLSSMELAGIVIATFTFYGKIASSLTTFKQNEVLRTNLSKHELLVFLDWLRLDYIPHKGQASNFTIEEDFNPLYIYSYQYTCWAIKNNIGFDTLTVKEAIEQKVLLVGGKDTIKKMTSDLKVSFRSLCSPYLAEEFALKVEGRLGEALTSSNDDLMERIIKGLDKKLEGAFIDFFAEFKKYRAYFERACLIKVEDELDLDFSSPALAVENATQTEDIKNIEVTKNDYSKNSDCAEQAIGQGSQSGSGKSESLLERLARIRANTRPS